MKKILFPATNRVHLARQNLLLDKLGEYFEVCVATYGEKELSMPEIAVDITKKIQKAIELQKPDFILVRGDRFELLPVAMLGAYNGIKIAQIEAGDLSGVIDNKVRFAISHLSDYHFATNTESEARLKRMGFNKVFNVGSLDCEYAMSVEGQRIGNKPYILYLWHNVPNEDESIVLKALESFKEYEIIGVRGNKDYNTASRYKEEYSPEEFIRLLKGASCLVGNSSAGIKEAGILGVPVINIGSRQKNRLRTHNIVDCPVHVNKIGREIAYQLNHGTYKPDYTYYQKDTSHKICQIIKSIV